MAQLVAALITVHGLLSFLSDVYGLFDPSGKTLRLFVDHRRLRPDRRLLPAGDMLHCHFVLLDNDESCPTADLSNTDRPNGPAYSTGELC